ncbi:hypothetical protein ACIQVE_20395 [Pseudomonas sp. NPDC098747]|uniref:hypothetical protein n=1 Tax=Pseudomonas sp. NPDC098747 TaxID=3364487 RepID=UPI00383A3D19
MQIQVITGEMATGKTRRLRAIEAAHLGQGEEVSLIHADAYAVSGLLRIMEVRVHTGQRTLLVDDCTRQQIDAVLEWQSAVEEDELFKELDVYLVRKVS